jgi:hypothetical protein
MRNIQVIAGWLALIAIAGAALATHPSEGSLSREQAAVSVHTLAPHDWDWLVGSWRVHHRRLEARLVGSTKWEEFEGTLVNWTTMGGAGNVGDNVMERPGGTLRGLGIRAFDSDSRQWLVWWLSASTPGIAPPMHGGFEGGIGTFFGADTLNGKPIKVRVRWSRITRTSAHWEQAFSPDGGATWEVNWTSDFTRVK